MRVAIIKLIESENRTITMKEFFDVDKNNEFKNLNEPPIFIAEGVISKIDIGIDKDVAISVPTFNINASSIKEAFKLYDIEAKKAVERELQQEHIQQAIQRMMVMYEQKRAAGLAMSKGGIALPPPGNSQYSRPNSPLGLK